MWKPRMGITTSSSSIQSCNHPWWFSMLVDFIAKTWSVDITLGSTPFVRPAPSPVSKCTMIHLLISANFLLEDFLNISPASYRHVCVAAISCHTGDSIRLHSGLMHSSPWGYLRYVQSSCKWRSINKYHDIQTLYTGLTVLSAYGLLPSVIQLKNQSTAISVIWGGAINRFSYSGNGNGIREPCLRR